MIAMWLFLLEDSVRYIVPAVGADPPRHSAPGFVLGRLERIARHPEPPPRLDDEQVAEVQLALALRGAPVVDQPLRASQGARRGEQLDRHVRQPLQLLLPVDDLAPVLAND